MERIKNLIFKNTLYVVTAIGFGIGIWVAVNWSSVSFLRRMTGLFAVAIVLHVWEESRFPGGFTRLITEKLQFTQKNPYFGDFVLGLMLVLFAFIPFFFPTVIFLVMAPMILGIFEAIVHTAVIKLFNLPRFYSPGMTTALVLLLPISVYAFVYAISNDLITVWTVLFSAAYMLAFVMVAQQIVVRASGMKYGNFLRNIKNTIKGS